MQHNMYSQRVLAVILGTKINHIAIGPLLAAMKYKYWSFK